MDVIYLRYTCTLHLYFLSVQFKYYLFYIVQKVYIPICFSDIHIKRQSNNNDEIVSITFYEYVFLL